MPKLGTRAAALLKTDDEELVCELIESTVLGMSPSGESSAPWLVGIAPPPFTCDRERATDPVSCVKALNADEST